jgi:ADP-ribose pyrophosphatase YjhB (NUDIX family)
VPERPAPTRPLPKEEFDRIYSRVPRLTVEVIVHHPERGVVLALRDIPPNEGLWHIPGGTVLFAEPVAEAYGRVAREELGLEVAPGRLLGYIEYPSHYLHGLDCPVGLAFLAELPGPPPHPHELPDGCAWFEVLPDALYEEQRDFLTRHLGLRSRGG